MFGDDEEIVEVDLHLMRAAKINRYSSGWKSFKKTVECKTMVGKPRIFLPGVS